MAQVALLKPKTVGASILTTGSTIGIVAGTDHFLLKVKRSRWNHFSPTAETTGDGDTYPRFENNCMLYADFALIGWMPATGAFGLAGLVDNTTPKNPATTALAHNLSSGLVWTQKFIIERTQMSWDRVGPYATMILLCKMTDTDPTTIETYT